MSKGTIGFSITIFLPDGNPEGLKIIGKSHWTGKGIAFSRSEYKQCSARSEFNRPGVYVLVGESQHSSKPLIYIGEGDPVRRRLDSHYANKDFWVWGVFFVSSDDSLNKAHIKTLESRLLNLAQEVKRCVIDNAVGSEAPTLSEWETANVDSFLADMLSIFPLLGLSCFEKPLIQKNKKKAQLYLHAKGLSATGQELANGFIVFKGSQMSESETSSIHHYFKRIRKELVEGGQAIRKTGYMLLAEDVVFMSPSTAAGVMLGRAANGRTEWKDEHGKTLKEIQTESVMSGESESAI